MKRGPSPSRASVELPAVTQLEVKKESPTAKRRRSSSVSRFRAGREKALRVAVRAVPSPPERRSSRSAGEGPPPLQAMAAAIAAAEAAAMAMAVRRFTGLRGGGWRPPPRRFPGDPAGARGRPQREPTSGC